MERINLNQASVDDLTRIAGIGRVTAEKVIDYRNKKGGIRNYDELKNISDIEDTMRDKIKSGTTLQ